MHILSIACAFGAAFAAALSAQVNTGDIGVTGFSTTSFAIFTPGPVVTGYATPGFGGSGAATSQAILFDPLHPNDFIVGGFGFIGRCTITGPGTVTYALITSAIGTASQMEWDLAGQLIVADAGTDQVRRVDPATGSITDLSIGAQPWGVNVNAGAIDPATQDVIVGGSGALYRLPFGMTTGVQIASNLGGFVSGVTFDPITGEIIATVLTSSRLIRVSASATVTDLLPANTIANPNAVSVDQNGDFIVGGGNGVYRVPYAGGSATFIAANTSPTGTISGVSVAKGRGFAIPFGQGCAGAGGLVTISATGPYSVGSTLTSTSHDHAPGTLGVLILGLNNTSYASFPLPHLLDPMLGTSNCYLNVSIDASLIGFTNTSTPADLAFSFPLTAPFGGRRFYLQHACFEAVAGGLSWSPGLIVQIQ